MNKKKSGISLIENLVSILLLSILLFGILDAFFISALSLDRTKHRMMAMNTVRQYMEQEVKAGYLGGYGSDYYVTVSSSDPVAFTIDDKGTSSTADDITGTIRADPYPAVTYMIGTAPKTARYKKVGFKVEWNEKLFAGVSAPKSFERVVAYAAEHN